MNRPLLSVVIPTYKRSRFLARAITSALDAAPDGSVEVIVVPNGSDDSWKPISQHFSSESRVLWHPIRPGHANVARNHGTSLARGKYIRFLDDDDVLYPYTAALQINALEKSGASICSGSVDMSDDVGRVFGTWHQPTITNDFIAAVCSNRRMLQVTAHVFRTEVARSVAWDATLPYSQDIAWFLDIARAREVRWEVVNYVVGCWHRHTAARISTHASIHRRREIICERLIALTESLAQQGRLTPERRLAISEGIWDQIHHALCFAPAYWSKKAKWVISFNPGSRPAIPLFENTLVARIIPNPLLLELCIAPYRLLRHGFRVARHRLGLSQYW